MYKEVSKFLDPLHYADIIKSGGLSQAISNRLDFIGSKLNKPDKMDNELPFACSYIKTEKRFCQFMTASNERLFSVDCWSEGIKYGGWWLSDLNIAVSSAVAFLEKDLTCDQMKKLYHWFVSEVGELHEKPPEMFVKHRWKELFKRLNQEPG